MGEKLYKPIIKNGDHLVKSKNNPNRVRGLTRDENNQNPDIIEWEEVEVEDVYDYSCDSCYNNQSLTNDTAQLSEEDIQRIADGIAFIVVGGMWLIGDVIIPWWKAKAWPWLCNRGKDIKQHVTKKKKSITQDKQLNIHVKSIHPDTVSDQIDQTFETCCFDMNVDEAEQHIMNIINHMIGIANEIRIISNARIKDQSETDEIYIERKSASEHFLAEKVAFNLNRLLSDENLRLDTPTSKDVFGLTGGGVRLNGKYVPVEVEKIKKALLAYDMNEE